MAFECILAHCATRDKKLEGRMLPAPWRSREAVDQMVIDVGFVAGLMQTAGNEPLTDDEALRFYRDHDPDGTGLIRFGALKALACWEPPPNDPDARQAIAPHEAVKAARAVQEKAMRELKRYESAYGVKIEIADAHALPAPNAPNGANGANRARQPAPASPGH